MPIQTILCPVALGERDDAVLSWALNEAQAHDAKITLLHAVEPLNPTAQMLIGNLHEEKLKEILQSGLDDAEQTAQKKLEHFCTDHMCLDLRGDSRIGEIKVARGQPEEVILKEAKANPPDLIVLGAHTRPTLGEMLLGSVAHRIVQKARVPVVVVRD